MKNLNTQYKPMSQFQFILSVPKSWTVQSLSEEEEEEEEGGKREERMKGKREERMKEKREEKRKNLTRKSLSTSSHRGPQHSTLLPGLMGTRERTNLSTSKRE